MNSNSKVLYLASKSKSRQQLLKFSKISFQLISNNFQEPFPDKSLSLKDNVLNIATEKMNNLVFSDKFDENEEIFVLTADTLTQDSKGYIHGKPKNKEDTIKKIKLLRASESYVATGFCLDKKMYTKGTFSTLKRISNSVLSSCFFDIPDKWIEKYLKYSDAEHSSGGIIIEDFGMQFLKKVNGSYSSILGLPLFEVRKALEKIGFFD